MDWDNIPDWIKMAITGALSSLGTMVAGYFVALSDNKRTRTEDRVEFTSQVMARLAAVEKQMKEEREYYEKKMALLKEEYQKRLESRDDLIHQLRLRDENREARLQHLERLLQGLE